MSKRKRAKASKRERGSKIAARAQRNKQAVVRSPKENFLRSVAAGSTESPPELHDDSRQEAPIVDNRATALQDDLGRMMRDHDSRKGFDVSLATSNVAAYQGKLLEIAQANIQFAFEFTQRLATVRSPFEILNILEEFTSKRIGMFWNVSKEMAELVPRRK
ncbi:MAG: Phasin protein [Bradyrhizobium sp.]|uniref:Phasin protein n=1 Tax=Bradyrhizobium sp. TaxID=376 RepID=UPI0025C679DB|nr:Phasin protein [Bradyrhizobium sp.]MBI5265427.1 Phasin protein [Bradyrhizobium sp.]